MGASGKEAKREKVFLDLRMRRFSSEVALYKLVAYDSSSCELFLVEGRHAFKGA